MTGTFRLTRAEFKKIFKRPSVFIMAVILVIAIFVSLYTFNPTTRVDNTVDYNQTTSLEYYNVFINGATENTKTNIDQKFDEVDQTINYYKLYNDRNSALSSYYNDILSSVTLLEGASLETKTEKYNQVKDALENFKKAISSFDTFTLEVGNEYPFISTTASLEVSVKEDGNTTSYNYLGSSLKKLNHLISYAETHTYSEFLNTFNLEDNKYKSELEKLLDGAQNYIKTTFQGLFSNITYDYLEYETSTKSSIPGKEVWIRNKNNLKASINAYKDYLEVVTDNTYPLITIDKSSKASIDELLNSALDALSIPLTDEGLYSSHQRAFENLAKLYLINNLNSLTNAKISQVMVNNHLINDYQKIQTKVTENKENLVTKITELKNDEAVSNIQKAITEYYLLSESYSSYIYDKTIVSITENYEKSEYENFYKLKLDEYNKYQVSEQISLNAYYIENNTYENSYLNNFSFNQKSDTKDTNAYDFMYFAMEICTVVIMIFAVMLMCNLITGESESGTIKLLLVRPYKRSKIITAKLLATLFFVTVFMVFSSVISFVGGYFLFGLPSSNVLAVFNATSVFEIHPLALMVINILTLLLDIIFFVVIALMIAVLFKNYAGSISAVLVVVIVNYVLNILFGGTIWYSVLPGMNLHLFKYFGNTFVSMGTASVLETIFITTIESSMTFVFSVLINLAYLVIALAISYSVFHKRDF